VQVDERKWYVGAFMRSIASFIAIVLALASCHGNKPAQDPESAGEAESSSKSSKSNAESEPAGSSAFDNTSGGASASRSGTPLRDDGEQKKDAPCSGEAIGDLLASLSQASCEVAPNATAPQNAPSKDTLDVRATTDYAVAPGATAQVTVVFHNKSQTALPLDFTVDPDPRVALELYTPKGARVDLPPGSEPSLPTEAADNEAAESHIARVTLLPNGTATIVMPWLAVKYKWASKEKAKGAISGHGYPREPAGPLPKGKYVLRVITPLVHIEEGIEHELSQPHTSIEVRGAGGPEPSGSAFTTSSKKTGGSRAPSRTTKKP
jgi:hypothetical protein